MPYGTPAQLANLKAWKPGNKAPRRSHDVERCFKLARGCSCEAMEFLVATMRDASESMRYRLKAADVIIKAAMPKDPDAFLGDTDATTEFRITFVNSPELEALYNGPPQANGHARGNGHDPEPLKIKFVDPKTE